MPQAYLFIQVSDEIYVTDILMKISADIRAQYSQRVFFVSKITNAKVVPKLSRAIRACFPGFDAKKQLKALGAVHSGPAYEKNC